MLVVDDIPHNRMMLVNLLTSVGLQVLEASQGTEALVLAQAYQPEAIITDLIMPEMDGLELIRQLRQQPELQQTAIIASSASVFKQNEEASLAAGATAFLPKPVQADQLFEILQTSLSLTWVYADEESSTSQPEPLPA